MGRTFLKKGAASDAPTNGLVTLTKVLEELAT